MNIVLKRAEKGVRVGRFCPPASTRAAAGEDGRPRIISGVSAPYDSWTVMADNRYVYWRERYARGCFDASIARDDVRCTFNHNMSQVLGRTSAKTLRLDPAGEGLRYEVDVNEDDPMALAVWSRVMRRDVIGASTWFTPQDTSTEQGMRDGRPWFDDTIVRADLFEQGPVTDGAYTDATAEARAMMRAFAGTDNAEFAAELRAILAGGAR